MPGNATNSDFNLLVSFSWRAPGRSRREIAARLRALGDPAPLVVPTDRKGIMIARTRLDPREAIHGLRALHHDAPAAFRYTFKWVPVDLWTAPDAESLRQAVVRLRDRIRPGERWRISIERRAPACPVPAVLIAALAPLIDGTVDLSHPDKILRIELFSDRAAVAVVTHEEMFSIVGRPRRSTLAPSKPGEHRARGAA